MPFLPVSLFCLSNCPDSQRYSAGLKQLRSAGFAVQEPPLPVPRLRQFAGDDAYRGADFNRAVSEEPSGGLLMAVRGGSGAARALPYIDFAALKRSGKIVCGYSDTTALLLAAAARGCTRLLHGPMLCSSWTLPPDSPQFQRELDSFAAVLRGGRELLPGWARPVILHSGKATGNLFAANLTLLETLIGTPYLPDLTGAILVVEDVNAPAHDIDRKLNHLRQAGILECLSALMFGSFTDAEDGEFIPEIEEEYASYVHGPVLAGFPVGHDHPSITIPCNRLAALDVSADVPVSLRLEDPLQQYPLD